MASLVNPYFHKVRTTEQSLVEGLVRESIQVLGSTYYYCPREVQIENLILGEDVISKFGVAIPIEMYLADAGGFTGDKEMFSKFGLELRNTYKLEISKKRWEDEIGSQFDNDLEYLLLETTGRELAFESGDMLVANDVSNGEAPFDIVNYTRPREGDLIYDPMTKFLMEIKFVDHDAEFFALGQNYKYVLSCEAFQYQQEIIATGHDEIDLFADNSIDILNDKILLESGDTFITEYGTPIINEGGVPVVTPIRESGTDFQPDAVKIKVTVSNPFGE